jgi:ribonuclease M5
MIKTREAVIVEGKYDKARLANIIDGVIIPVNGFHIFDDKDTLNLIRYYAENEGIIILTDSDTAGFKIRNFIKNCVKNNGENVKPPRIIHIYAPDIFGKEHRKKTPSKEGKLGIEGISDDILIKLFSEAGIENKASVSDEKITKTDLYLYGFSGTENSVKKRRDLLKSLDLPELLSAASLVELLNSKFTKTEFANYLANNFHGDN